MSADADRAVVASDTGRNDAVLYDVRDSGVAIITLNRPDRMNGWGGPLAAGFYESIDRPRQIQLFVSWCSPGRAGRFARAPTWA
jgi:hypothetical protein